MDKITWKTEKRKVSELIPFEFNPRVMSQKQVEDLRASIEKFNLAEIPAVNTDNKIIAGHQRLMIMKMLGRGDEEIDVRVPSRSLTSEEFKEYNLRSNKNTGAWNWDLLQGFDRKMLRDVGFTADELSAKLSPPVSEDDFDADRAREEALKNLTVRRGDIYQLGRHKLMCGDSTDANDVAKLMGEEKADMIFTDPPYNVNYLCAKYAAIHNDNKDELQFYQFLLDAFHLCDEYSHDHAPMYVCYGMKTQIPFMSAYRDAGYLFSQTIIWLKERIILAMGQDYHRVYEPILYGWKQGSKRFANHEMKTDKEVWDLDRRTFEERLDVWYISRDKSSDYVHPTQKPIRLVERAMKKSSKIGDLLYEPFNGSGSTMMACEQSDRRCHGMELDPAYVQAAIQRWETFVGEKAKKL